MQSTSLRHGLMIAGAILLLMACGKQNHDSMKPMLVLSAPAPNQTYNNGDTVFIKGTLTDDSLHELLIKVERTNDNVALFQESISVHDLSSYTIDRSWKSSVTVLTNARVIARAVDHGDNVVSDTVNIVIQP